MAKTIEARAIAFMNNHPNMDDSYYDYYVRDGYIQGATDQDRIARQEERERCIKVAQDTHCLLCPINRRCELIENGTIGIDTWNRRRCSDRVNIRKAMEGGNKP